MRHERDAWRIPALHYVFITIIIIIIIINISETALRKSELLQISYSLLF